MTLYFLDSSALAKLFVAELGSDRLIALIEPLAPAQKLISSLATVEVQSAIRRRQKAGQLSRENAAEALAILTAEGAAMTELPVNAAVIDMAREMLNRHTVGFIDAIQLASGWVARASRGTPDIVFVASDRVLLAAAQEEGLEVWDPEN